MNNKLSQLITSDSNILKWFENSIELKREYATYDCYGDDHLKCDQKTREYNLQQKQFTRIKIKSMYQYPVPTPAPAFINFKFIGHIVLIENVCFFSSLLFSSNSILFIFCNRNDRGTKRHLFFFPK